MGQGIKYGLPMTGFMHYIPEYLIATQTVPWDNQCP